MKKKIKILIVSCVMAAAAVTGFNMAQNSNNMDVSLADIAVMARADGENPPPEPQNQAEGTKTVTTTTCVEFDFWIFKCKREVTTSTEVPCCVSGNSTCSAVEDC